MIKAIIFDWGGVLIDDPADGLHSYSAKKLGVSLVDFRKAYSNHEFEYYAGVTEKEFWKHVAADLKVKDPETDALWYEAFKLTYKENKGMFELAITLKNNGYKTGFLSNTEPGGVRIFKEQGYDMFDVEVFSCVEKMKKPDAVIYNLTLEKLGVKPEESVFIDDRQPYIDGAKKVGIKTILFQDNKQVKEELRTFGVQF